MLGINPGSEQARYTAERDGLLDTFNKFESTRIFTMLVDLVLDSGTEKVESKKKFYCSFFNRNFAKELTEPNTYAFVKCHQKW